MYLPSEDQSEGPIETGAVAITDSACAPVAPFTYSSNRPEGFELYATRPPSGDHTGQYSSEGLKVKRVVTFRPESRIQMSWLEVFPGVSKATCFPSGASWKTP